MLNPGFISNTLISFSIAVSCGDNKTDPLSKSQALSGTKNLEKWIYLTGKEFPCSNVKS